MPGVGLFRVRGPSPGPERANHSVAAERCRDDNGELAHVLSEARTTGLSSLLSTKGLDSKNRTTGPVNRAYVDLDDIAQEGMFVTSAGKKGLPPLREPTLIGNHVYTQTGNRSSIHQKSF